MAALATRTLTVDEYYDLPDLPDGSKRELVRGEVIVMPNPGVEHGKVQVNIAGLLWLFLRKNKLGTAVTESGVVTERDEDTVRGPEVSYSSKARMPLDRRVVKYNDQSPDLCVEIVSPSNTKRQLRQKTQEYFAAGVRMLWIVEPEDRSVTVLTSPQQGRTFYDGSELDGGEVLPGFTCSTSELFD